jgi:hypothetical protein
MAKAFRFLASETGFLFWNLSIVTKIFAVTRFLGWWQRGDRLNFTRRSIMCPKFVQNYPIDNSGFHNRSISPNPLWRIPPFSGGLGERTSDNFARIV